MEKYPLWTAMVTPLKKDGGIDYESFEKILREQEKAGNGVLVLGSTGEGLNLLDEEKREIVKFVKLLNLDVPLMAGIGGFHIDAQITFMKYCDDVGVDAFLLVNPLYAKPGKEGQLAWFSTLMKETRTPCMIYNVPSRTGGHMHPAVPAYLHNTFPNYMGLKEASGSVEKMKEFMEHAPKAKIYCGDDNLVGEFIAEGAVGLVSVASNAWPVQAKKQVELHLVGREADVFGQWSESAGLLFKAPNPIPVKTLMQHKGWLANDQVRLPLSNDDMDLETEKALLEADQKINDWFGDLS